MNDANDEFPAMSTAMMARRADAEEVIMKLAARQYGVVTRAQLIRAGVSAETVAYRVRAGRLRKLHRGVYLVGPLSAPNTRVMAAVLACGEGAAVSGRNAAAIWQMLPPPARDSDPVEVIAAGSRPLSRAGIRVRLTRSLLPEEVTVRDGIPMTSPARTLFDVAVVVSDRELERAVAETFALQLARRSQILALLDHHAGRRGERRLRELLREDSQIALCRSEAEERFLKLIRKADLGRAEANARIAGYEVDFLWRAERLVVEIDGRAYHTANRKFEADRRRDAALVAAGLRVIRVTWNQIMNEPEALIVLLAQALVR
jgi:very-short-patch-repair endonuclease